MNATQGSYQSAHAPIPGARVARTLLFGILLVAALLPGRLKPWVNVLGIPVYAHELAFLGIVALLAYSLLFRPRSEVTWQRHVLGVATGMFCYGALSLAWSAAKKADLTAMAYTLVLAAAATWAPYLVVRLHRSSELVREFLSILTLLLTAVAALYSAESFLNLGLRSEEGSGLDPVFGLHRVRGPLFASSTGGFVLVPALAFALQQFLQGNQRPKNGAMAIILLIACFGMGSRATMIALAIFVVLTATSLRGIRQRTLFAVALLIVGLSAGAFVFSRASAERVMSMEDNLRAMTYRTAGIAIADAPVIEKLVGQGYGSYWRWYLVDAAGNGNTWSDEFIQNRPAGPVLYHPHSTPLMLALELGIPGVSAALAMAIIVSRARRRSLQAKGAVLLLNGVIGAAFVAVTDLMIFKTPFANLVWWAYLFGALALAPPPIATSLLRGPPSHRLAH